ncbi:MAG: single-stranded-DNA-specific exonuclease RecJ, partial [Methyloligellaceae bacterium]
MTALGSQTLQRDERRPAFLRVERSARGLRWIERLPSENEQLAIAIAQNHDVPEILARLLAGRGVDAKTVPDYLDPTLKALMPDPSTLQDMDAAAECLAHAIRDKRPMAVFGDYDVDGAASVSLLRRFVRAHGHETRFYIPDRTLEGYGPSVGAFEQLIEDGAELIITVDCGTASHEPIARARALGAEVIVLDHHQADEKLPDALAVVNPNRQDDVSGQGHLAAAGVVYLFLVATARQLRCEDWYGDENAAPDLLQWLDLAALATVCDVVPLIGLNRALVARGLQVMRQRRNPGLRMLADTARLTSAPTTYHLGFVFGPRLNAGGRIGRADLAAQLLSIEDETQIAEIAATLESLNAERRAMQEALQEEALSQAEANIRACPDAAIAVAEGERWHKGLVGLVAARLTERLSLPSLVISWDADGTGSGSARSIPGADIGAAIRGAAEAGHVLRGGGHAMAAGFTLTQDKAEAFVAYMDDQIRAQVSLARSEAQLKLDGALMASSATSDLMAILDRAGPFGAGNPQPRFAFPSHRCK